MIDCDSLHPATRNDALSNVVERSDFDVARLWQRVEQCAIVEIPNLHVARARSCDQSPFRLVKAHRRNLDAILDGELDDFLSVEHVPHNHISVMAAGYHLVEQTIVERF